MTNRVKIDVAISGFEAETHRTPWNGPDGIGLSVQGEHLLIAVHHDGQTHAVWLSGTLLDHAAAQLGGAARQIMNARQKAEQAAARWGTVQ